MSLSFRARLTLRWLAASGLVLAVALVAVYVGAQAYLRRDLDAQLRTLAATELASAVDEPGTGIHLHEFSVRDGREYADKFVQLVSADGQVFMQSPVLGASPPVLDRDLLARALAGEPVIADVRAVNRSGRMVGLRTAGPNRYVVAVGLFTERLGATLGALRWLLLAVWAGSLAVTAVVGFSMATTVLAPVHQITERAAAIADGQFDTRLDPPAHDDEIGRMAALLGRMLDRLRAALDANRRFAADASHELRGPLTAMLGEIDVTLKRDRDGDDYRRALGVVRRGLEQMSRLTADLMLLARAQERQRPPLAEVPLAAVVADVVAGALPGAASAGVAIDQEVPEDLVVYGDAGLIGRVVDNLVRNAVQYNRQDGRVTITARLEADPAASATDLAVLRVSDTGPGIPEAERERVFERFHRLDASRSRRTGGAGLGLAIAREIVQLFGGRIAVVDPADGGTTLEVHLPGGRRIA
ncbi:MAG: sensor histidine kinase [Vicinamibacterales bacterium]